VLSDGTLSDGSEDKIIKLESGSDESDTEIKTEAELLKPSGLGFREMFKLQMPKH